MHLPSIFSTNQIMKDQDRNNTKQNNEPKLGIGNQFGLGIQVFKIQSSKNVGLGDQSNQRKLMKNIENPKNILKPPMPKPRIPSQLPALQKQEKFNTGNMINRKSLNKRVNVTTTEIKPSHSKPKQTYSSKTVHNKQMNSEKQIETVKQPVITYTYYSQSFNQLQKFYVQMQDTETVRQRELKKLLKMNKNQMSKQMQIRLQQVNNSECSIFEIVNSEKLGAFQNGQQYDDYQITEYDFNKGFENKNYQQFLYSQS